MYVLTVAIPPTPHSGATPQKSGSTPDGDRSLLPTVVQPLPTVVHPLPFSGDRSLLPADERSGGLISLMPRAEESTSGLRPEI